MPNRYPENIMKRLRESKGLDEEDTSKDDELNINTPDEAFEIVCNYEGLINYSDTIRRWINDIYDVDLSEISIPLNDHDAFAGIAQQDMSVFEQDGPEEPEEPDYEEGSEQWEIRELMRDKDLSYNQARNFYLSMHSAKE